MDRPKIIDPKNPDNFFEIPYEWLPRGVTGPTLNDLEAKAERSKLKAKLYRARAGEVPAGTLEIIKRLSQKELFPFFKLIRNTEVYIYYFEKYANKFITRKFYVEKVNPPWWQIPEDNNTDNIIYDKFTINFSGYEDVNI